MTYPEVWPGRCTVRGCQQIAGVAMTKNYGQERWARCNDHLGCDDDGNKIEVDDPEYNHVPDDD